MRNQETALKPPRSGQIVLVEDDRDMCSALVTLLEAIGYEVLAFGCAELALGEGAFDEPGCILVDIHLPGMTGIDMVKRLRARGCLWPVVFITAHDDEYSRTESTELDAELLRKPFSASVLKEALHRAFAARKGRR